MDNSNHNLDTFQKWKSILRDVLSIFQNEFKVVFSDRGVVIVFILASLVYPLLYCGLYKNETLVNTPIAVVDKSGSVNSRTLLRHIDASPDVEIAARFTSMAEAQNAFDERKVHGIVYIPVEFNKKLNSNQQATVSIYCDMSSFLYYRALMQACNYSVLDMGKQVQLKRLNAQGIVGESASIISEPIPFEGIGLYNGGMGFASFLMPAILMLIIHQTLFFGICMLAGTSREENRFHELVSSKLHRGGTFRVIVAKAACYLSMYLIFSVYILEVIPHIFNLPHIGAPLDILKLMIPFLLATIFFSMTISVFFPNRETGMILFLFFSLILLFLSGISWPISNINGFWKAFSWMFPAVQGIQAYIKINTMGANISQIKYEYVSLWIQTGLYFISSIVAYSWQIKKSTGREMKEELIQYNAPNTF
jgi:ABC-2 type transport system permease protein